MAVALIVLSLLRLGLLAEIGMVGDFRSVVSQLDLYPDHDRPTHTPTCTPTSTATPTPIASKVFLPVLMAQ